MLAPLVDSVPCPVTFALSRQWVRDMANKISNYYAPYTDWSIGTNSSVPAGMPIYLSSDTSMDIYEAKYHYLLAGVYTGQYITPLDHYDESFDGAVLEKFVSDGFVAKVLFYEPEIRHSFEFGCVVFYTEIVPLYGFLITDLGVVYLRVNIDKVVEACCLQQDPGAVFDALKLLDTGEFVKFLVHEEKEVREMVAEIMDGRGENDAER